MATSREQIEHPEHRWEEGTWKKLSHSRKWLKKQMNRYLRRKNKTIGEEESTSKVGRKPYQGWEY